MRSRDPTSCVQVHLPERWPEPGPLAAPPVRWTRRSGDRFEDGVSALQEVPPADAVTVVVPCSRVTFVRALLPRGPAAKLARLAPFAIEDAIARSPEDVRAAVLDDLGGGERLIAVLDRRWFDAVLEAFDAAGAKPDRVIVESALAAERDAWTVVWAGDAGFAALGSAEAIGLDASVEGRPPLALKLAADEARARGRAPGRVRVLCANAASVPDLARWSASLHLPVVDGGRWHPERIDTRRVPAADLRAGADPAGGRAADWLARLRMAMIAAGVVLGVHATLTLGDWLRLRLEERAIRSGMETRFRNAFPAARSVVDPALQMERNLAELRRAAGVPDAGDVLPLLARIAPALGAGGVRMLAMRYERGQLELELALPPGESEDTLAARLRAPGIVVRIERLATGAAGPVATVRLSAGET
jgi:general secretion pathway protein L